MKKHFVLITGTLFLMTVLSSCFRDHDISISVSENEDVYKMTAKFDRHRTKAVQYLLKNRLHIHSSGVFENTSMDDEITLDNGTSLYIVTRPGRLKIKIDKSENSEDAYYEVKGICEDIKQLLADNRQEE